MKHKENFGFTKYLRIIFALLERCWKKHDSLNIFALVSQNMRSAKTCVRFISLRTRRYIEDPIAEIASLNCTFVEGESDKIVSTGLARRYI